MFLAPNPFFVPAPSFLEWMKGRYANHPIIDIGCGYGNFTGALLVAGCTGAVGIDLNLEKLEIALTRCPVAVGRLLFGDTRTHSIVQLEQAVIVFARPCHDSAWIEDTVEHARKTASTFLYISKPGNEARDIAGFERRRVAWDIEIGMDGEQCWEFRPLPDGQFREDLADWCLIEAPHGNTGTFKRVWSRDGGDVWFWDWGPSRMSKHGERVITKATISQALKGTGGDWLDKTVTSAWQYWDKRVDDESLDNGWVSPEGRLYRCAYHEHDGMVYDYLLMETVDLEKAGWCKLQRPGGFPHHHFVTRRDLPLTKPQVETLIVAGFRPPIYMLEEAEGDWSAVIDAHDDGEFGGLEKR